MAEVAVLADVCAAFALGEVGKASAIAGEKYPLPPRQSFGRRYTKFQSTQIVKRDCFVDRYSGGRLVFPATLRLLGIALPDSFPYHPNWKMCENHTAYWEMFPTVDHVVPVARGGVDDETDWVSTSMLRNSAKSGRLLEEPGWRLQEPGNLDEWDGLTSWFLDYCDNHPSHMVHRYLALWYRVARQSMGIAQQWASASGPSALDPTSPGWDSSSRMLARPTGAAYPGKQDGPVRKPWNVGRELALVPPGRSKRRRP